MKSLQEQNIKNSKGEVKGLIFNIQRYSIHDGPGIRTTIFFKGCPLSCWWCHNPEGISPKKEIMYFDYKCIKCKTCSKVCPTKSIKFADEKIVINRESCIGCGICAEACPTGAIKLVGMDVDVKYLITEIERDIRLYDETNGGVTFSGGEPLYQPKFLINLAKECKEININTALDTSGYATKEIMQTVAKYIDIFLYDVKIMDEEKHKEYCGVSNKPIIENLKLLVELGRAKDIILRFPIIPGITDTEENVQGISRLITEKLRGVGEIDLLPFHSVEEKYARLGRPYLMKIHNAPTDETLKRIREEFERIGLYVKIGG